MEGGKNCTIYQAKLVKIYEIHFSIPDYIYINNMTMHGIWPLHVAATREISSDYLKGVDN